MEPRRDPLGALMPEPQPQVAGAERGPLRGLAFVAKDIFDVAGVPTGCGNPDYRAAAAPAERHAWAVERLLAAGAELVGKSITDEFAYSLNGRNAHYGTPTNGNAPGRLPGGSSSGSAAAVAGGLVPAALGSDTGGSIRIPASFCGVFGLRPTHGAIPLEGVMPLAPSFDTVGWFARDAATLGRIGAALLPPDAPGQAFRRLLVPADAWDLALPPAQAALAPIRLRLEQRVAAADPRPLAEPGGLAQWMEDFRLLQAREIARGIGRWVAAHRPRLGPEIQERFDWALGLPPEADAGAAARRPAIRASLAERLGDDGLLLLPGAPGPAPLLATPAAELADWRLRVLSLTAIAGLAGLPQVSLPLAEVEGAPLGVGLVAGPGRDRALLAFAARFAGED